MDRNKLILCKDRLTDVVLKMEDYIINNEYCEPITISIMYVSVRDTIDIIREELLEA